MRQFVRLAGKIGKPSEDAESTISVQRSDNAEIEKKKKKKKKKKNKHKHGKTKYHELWLEFLKRAFIGAIELDELEGYEDRLASKAESQMSAADVSVTAERSDNGTESEALEL